MCTMEGANENCTTLMCDGGARQECMCRNILYMSIKLQGRKLFVERELTQKKNRHNHHPREEEVLASI